MKNKKTLYLLAPAVLLIWALIVYQVSESWGGGNVYYTGSSNSLPDQSAAATDTFQYTLQLRYPDPFLGKSMAPRSVAAPPQRQVTTEKRPQHAVVPSPQPREQLPACQYLGLVEHKGKQDKLALIALDGRSLMLREGEAYEDLALLKIYKDSVQLSWKQQRFYIKK